VLKSLSVFSRISGCSKLLSQVFCALSAKIISRNLARFKLPSGFNTIVPKCSLMAASPLLFGATTWRAIISASTTVMPPSKKESPSF